MNMTDDIYTRYDLHYTKLDGTRNKVRFLTREAAEAALAKAQAKHPQHDLAAKITVGRFNDDAPPVSAKVAHSERCQAAYEARVRGYGRY